MRNTSENLACCTHLAALGRRASGQILVPVALMLTTVMGLVGAGVDYSVLVVENARLQHALDAASLAGARALVSGNNPGTAAAESAAVNILSGQGYTAANTTLTYTYSSSLNNSFQDTVRIDATRQQPTFFWRAIGINNSTLARHATASASGGMVDVMLTLDLTGSMEQSGTNDLGQLRQAVVDFVNQMNPSAAQPLGAKVGMARWAGVGCSWARGNGNVAGNGGIWSPNVANQRGDGDKYIDLNNASGSGTGSWTEYVTPCYDDLTVLSPLSFNKSQLTKLADNSGASDPICNNFLGMGCPLQTFDWKPAVVYGTPTTPLDYQQNNTNQTTKWNTGTKLPNAISVVNPGQSFASATYAWSTANGGRNNDLGEGYARKVLVMITDGFNEISPTVGTPVSMSTWDTDVVNYATTLKRGPDGVAGTQDDVEIYVVGFFCVPYSTSTSIPQKWCASKLADTAITGSPHPCPSATMPGTARPIDTMLRDVSSSTSGSCDHYYPIAKTESLPTLFRVIAGSVARGRITQ